MSINYQRTILRQILIKQNELKDLELAYRVCSELDPPPALIGCRWRSPNDGCCMHPDAMTLECHQWADCPMADQMGESR